MNKIIKNVKNGYLAKCKYLKYYLDLPIEDNVIVLESQQGKEYQGNVYYIIDELLNKEEYKSFKVFLSVRKNKISEATSFYQGKGMDSLRIVEFFSDKYYRLMASAKYLVTDNAFLFFFVKKEGQVYLNTWHGTPLKTLGKKINNDLHNIGNAQRNFIFADYLLFPNKYTQQHMIEDYMLQNLCSNTCLLSGYPRNTVFFNEKLKKQIRSEMYLDNKKVVAYMPTWRGTLNKKNKTISQANLQYILEELDSNLDDSFSVFVNLHPIEVAAIDFSQFHSIKPFPKQYETYEFLSIVDVLISDYSSVIFDYMNSDGKIILYAYDKEYYLSSRGLYRSLDSLPFPVAETMSEVINEIKSSKQYDDTLLRQEMCEYDSADSTVQLCKRVFLGKREEIIEEPVIGNGKENVFIYAGRLATNGITASLKNLLNNIDSDERNYFLLFETKSVAKHLSNLQELSQDYEYLTIKGKMNLSLLQKIILRLYDKKIIDTKTYLNKLKDAYQVELKRIFATSRVDSVIHFTGYSTKKINLFSQFNGNKIIYVHANMQEEIKLKGNQRLDALEYAYNNYDKVAVVTSDTIESTVAISKRSDNIYVCRNIIDYQTIINRSKEEMKFDEETYVFPREDKLLSVLKTNKIKFLHVGRFSPEKGQDRLLEAFSIFVKDHPNVVLIMVGGYSQGRYLEEMIQKAETLQIQEQVFFVKYLSNPFPLVAKCNYSVLPSYSEGFGLVLAEADVLHKPVFSVDIPGPRSFLKENHGLLVENSTEGIVEGFKKCINGEVKCMGIDYERYNQEAINEFNRLFV